MEIDQVFIKTNWNIFLTFIYGMSTIFIGLYYNFGLGSMKV